MHTRFILIGTSHAGNVGAAARAIKTMGFTDLVLVAPRWANVLRREETVQRASGANDVLARARVVATLEEALDGVSHLCATAMVARDFGPPTHAPRVHLPALAAAHASGQVPQQGVAFLFGSERFGMANEDVYRCHAALCIPTDPAFGSLNLAAAVQLLAYEWRCALGGFPPTGDKARSRTAQAPADAGTHPAAQDGRAHPEPGGVVAALPADAQALAGMLAHWERALIDVGFLDPHAPKKLMPRLNAMFNRAQPTPEEIHILRGIAKAMEQADKRHQGAPTAKAEAASALAPGLKGNA